MVDFKKRLNKTEIEKKTNPVELYDSLDRSSIAGPLRPAQARILSDWFTAKKDQRDLIIKLHTGEGKTLIGLLILLSKLNSGSGPCLYVCPNKYLVDQVCNDAKKFGVPYCIIEDDGSIPNEFIDSEKILVTHVQKVFNGKSKFGIGNNFVHVENLILDDSHACIDSIKDSFTITAGTGTKLYSKIIELFNDELSDQGEGTFLEILNSDNNSFLPIPYWTWIDKSDQILKILSEHKDDESVMFTWPIIKDDIKNCQGFVSGKAFEITPIHVPIDKFSSFSKAKQRTLMSATTQDDSFFIKGLGFNPESVKNPLVNPEQIWSGEKMIIIPSLIDDSLDREKIVSVYATPNNKRNFGVVALTSSFQQSEQYLQYGSIAAKSSDIVKVVNELKTGNYAKTVAIANRYDGIDLPDSSCRILLFDSKPFFYSLAERYEEINRLNSDLLNIRIAQRIEQGLGRSVRGEKDYSAILLIGGDLVRFIKSSQTNKYFSSQTKKQIEIGMEIAQMASAEVEAKDDPIEVVISLINQCLQRDEGWKEFYREEMNKIKLPGMNTGLYDILILEREAAVQNYLGDYEKACNLIQKIVDEHCSDDNEKGWYLQILARYKYQLSKIEANSIQKSAFLKNNELLKPKEGIIYKKLDYIDQSRINRIKNWVNKHATYEELMLTVDGVLSDLHFNSGADKFELALKDLGTMLGFLSQRPDKEIKKGPDNLWCGVKNQYFIFECKSEVLIERIEITKGECGQMNTHCAWFESEYGDAPVKRILIHPTKDLSYHAHFTHSVEIMRRGKLKFLRENVKSFFKEFKIYSLDSVLENTIQEFLITHKLDMDSLLTEYSEKYFHKKS